MYRVCAKYNLAYTFSSYPLFLFVDIQTRRYVGFDVSYLFGLGALLHYFLPWERCSILLAALSLSLVAGSIYLPSALWAGNSEKKTDFIRWLELR